MKLYSIARLLVAAFAAGAISLMAQAQDIADLTKELTGEKTAAQRAPDQMEAAYSKAIDSLLPDLGDDDPGKRGKAQVTLEQIAFNSSRPGAEAQRAACSKAIAAKLGADVPPLTSVWLIRQLERIGRAEAVDALAKALGGKDAQIRECARRALLKNSSAEAAEALRKTMAVASDSAWRIALINAMASRRDPADLAALLKEAASDADDVRIAAMVGLAKIGDKSAAPSLAAAMAKGSPEAKRVAADCHLLLADALSNKGEQAEALGIYKSMLSSQGYLKCGAIIGVGRAGGAGDLTTILQAMPDADARLRGACIDAMVLLKGKDVTEALCAKTKAAEPEMKLALFKALVRRADKTALPTFVSAAEDANEDLCVEAIRGLGAVGDASVTPLLLKIAANSGKPQDTARASLERLKGDDVDKALIAGIDEKDAKIRVEAIRALAGRRTAAAAPALLKSAEEADANVRGESFKALGLAAPTDALASVAALLLKAKDDAARSEAATALGRIAGRESNAEKRAEPILKALESSAGPARLSLLGVLGRIGGAKSLEVVRAALKDSDMKVKEAAIRAMGDWPDAATAPDLLEIAKTESDETRQVLAIRGYIRVVRIESGRPASETAKMLAAGLEAAKRSSEKKDALAGLAEVRNIAALEAAAPCMNDPTLAQEAASACAKIGKEIADGNPAPVKAAMEKVLEISKNNEAKKQAKEALDKADKKLGSNAPKK